MASETERCRTLWMRGAGWLAAALFVAAAAVGAQDADLPAPNALDADAVLATPPVHDARLRPHNGAMTLFLYDRPMSAQYWSHICIHNMGDEELKAYIDPESGMGFPIVAFPTAVGETIYDNRLPIPVTSWLAPDTYDWSYVDAQLGRIRRYNPDAKVIMLVAIDGAKWWTAMHPDAADPKNAAIGLPDYLSDQWRKDGRELLRQFIAHLQQRWPGVVIGYELFNGTTMDASWEYTQTGPRVERDFRAFLRERYHNDETALKTAWRDNAATFAAALMQLEMDPPAVIVEPARYQRLIDSRDFMCGQIAAVFKNFSRDVKEATHGRAIVGARTGDFFGNQHWAWPTSAPCLGTWMPFLLDDPNLDYFDVQEPYPGRQIGLGQGVPVLPPMALLPLNKAVFIQNDVRTHLSHPDEGYGRTANLEDTLSVQRRVFVNALANGSNPFLWQMSYQYTDPVLLADYRRQRAIMDDALARDRRTGAEVAVVMDPWTWRYAGRDGRYSGHSRAFDLFDYVKIGWARAGVPVDMVFLDQIAERPAYKVYVFMHTWRLDAAARTAIQEKVLKDGQVAVFVWADGIIADDGTFNPAALSALTGLRLRAMPNPLDWRLAATPLFERLSGTKAGTELGKWPERFYGPPWADKDFEPSLLPQRDNGARVLATRAADNRPGIVARDAGDYTVVFSASANLTEPLFRWINRKAGVHEFVDSDAMLMMNNSYVGLHTYTDTPVKLTFKTPEALEELFTGETRPAAAEHVIPVAANQTYLFLRRPAAGILP